MNPGELTLLQQRRQAWSDRRLAELAAQLLGVDPERRCSRCDLAVDPDDLSPGRYWCKPCENKRRSEGRHRLKKVVT